MDYKEYNYLIVLNDIADNVESVFSSLYGAIYFDKHGNEIRKSQLAGVITYFIGFKIVDKDVFECYYVNLFTF